MMTVKPTVGSIMNHTTSLPMKSPVHQALYMCAIILYCFNLMLSIINFTFGIVSWTVLPKWRQFKHYVYMNMIVASTINMIGFNLFAHHHFSNIIVIIILLIPRIIISHWLLVTTVMIYMDIVKGFNNGIKRPYLAANIFTWVVPCVEVLLIYAIDYFFEVAFIVTFNYVLCISVMAVSAVIYFVVVFNIIKLTLAKKGTRSEICSKITVATFCGIPSGLSTLLPILIMELMHSHLVTYNLMLILCLLSITMGHLVFITLKANREQWSEYRRKRNAIKSFSKA